MLAWICMAFAFFRTQKEVTVATVTDTITNEEIPRVSGKGFFAPGNGKEN